MIPVSLYVQSDDQKSAKRIVIPIVSGVRLKHFIQRGRFGIEERRQVV